MPADRERLEIIVTSEQKMLFQRAADRTESSLNEFIVASAEEVAEDTLRPTEVIKLSPEDSLIFAEALLNPGEPSENLRAAAREYRQFFGDSRSS